MINDTRKIHQKKWQLGHEGTLQLCLPRPDKYAQQSSTGNWLHSNGCRMMQISHTIDAPKFQAKKTAPLFQYNWSDSWIWNMRCSVCWQRQKVLKWLEGCRNSAQPSLWLPGSFGMWSSVGLSMVRSHVLITATLNSPLLDHLSSITTHHLLRGHGPFHFDSTILRYVTSIMVVSKANNISPIFPYSKDDTLKPLIREFYSQ